MRGTIIPEFTGRNSKILGLSQIGWGWLALLTFYGNLLGLADQIKLTHIAGVPVLSFWLLLLFLCASSSFSLWALSEARIDWFKLASRLPALCLVTLALWQFYRAKVQFADVLVILCLELVLLLLLRRLIRGSEDLRRITLKVSRLAFMAALTVGLAAQIIKFSQLGTQGGSLAYWILLGISYATWIPYGFLVKDRALVFAHAISLGLIAIIVGQFLI